MLNTTSAYLKEYSRSYYKALSRCKYSKPRYPTLREVEAFKAGFYRAFEATPVTKDEYARDYHRIFLRYPDDFEECAWKSGFRAAMGDAPKEDREPLQVHVPKEGRWPRRVAARYCLESDKRRKELGLSPKYGEHEKVLGPCTEEELMRVGRMVKRINFNVYRNGRLVEKGSD